MKRVRECPNCGFYNSTKKAYCEECGARLGDNSFRDVEDDAIRNLNFQKEEPVPEKEEKEVEIIECPNCGAENKNTANLCSVCHEPLGANAALLAVKKEEAPAVLTEDQPIGLTERTIQLIRDERSISVHCHETPFAIGRNAISSFIDPSKKALYSREHVFFYCKGGDVYAVDRSSTNGTLLNQMKMSQGFSYQLRDGDIITIYDLPFIVKLC